MPLDDAHSAPLYQIKANLFKALAHPARIRVLEILVAAGEQEVAVSELLAELDLEASHLSQHLAVLRRHGVLVARRSGNTVYYRIAHPGVAEMVTSARRFLVDFLEQSQQQLAATRELPPLPER